MTAQQQAAEQLDQFKDGVNTWADLVKSSRAFFDANRGCPMFQVLEMLDELYRVVFCKVPFPKMAVEDEYFLQRCFLICHRGLLSAATATFSGQPEDGAATTRRALEAAKVCLAVKAEPANYTEWKSVEIRKDCWKRRISGEKPKGTVSPKYKNLSTEPLYEALQAEIGALSDFSVHFTPEHLGGYEWERVHKPAGTEDIFFGLDEDAVAKASLWLVGSHRLIIRAFDRCLDGNLLIQFDVGRLAQCALNFYKELLQCEGFTKEAITLGGSW
jgi:hypothetical protein